jgi:hypothetical protein
MIQPVVRRRRGVAPAVGLFFLAPLFGEFLLGNLKLSELAYVPFLAPLYGAGALLIRETARRAGRGAACMLTLGVAYALIEEGLVDQMLFNQSYFAGQAEGSDTVIAALGLDAWLTVIVVAMHAVWSTFVPITIVEALVPDRRATPWLGLPGLVVTAVIFVAGSAWLCQTIYAETGFFATPGQLVGTAGVVAGLIAAAFTVRVTARPADRPVPRPWLAGGVAFAAGSLFMLTESLPGWLEVAGALLVVTVFAAVVLRWSRRPRWTELHGLALVGGAVLTYAWLGVIMVPESGPRGTADQIGSLVFAAAAIGLFALAIRSLRHATGSRGRPCRSRWRRTPRCPPDRPAPTTTGPSRR